MTPLFFLVLSASQVIGGNTTTTDAAYLSEYFHAAGLKTNVACVPCTISGGMKNNFVVSLRGHAMKHYLYNSFILKHVHPTIMSLFLSL